MFVFYDWPFPHMYSTKNVAIIIIIFLFDPGTQFPRNEKLRYAIQKSTKSSWNEPYSSSFTKQSWGKMALYRWIKTKSRLLLLFFIPQVVKIPGIKN